MVLQYYNIYNEKPCVFVYFWTKYFVLTNFYNRRLIQTADGSYTLYLPEMNEHYHSIHGALHESMHVFIREGLDKVIQPGATKINILEVGLGTGLNALLTLMRSAETGCSVNYLALEPYPLNREEVAALNYIDLAGEEMPEKAFRQMHELPFFEKERIITGFEFEKWHHKVHEASLPAESFDLVYFDAFGPQVQPELWTEKVFAGLFASMKPGGVIATYSAKGSVKRTLKACGFLLEHPPGPKGKREMTRGVKP